jgi:hypothetical protein
MMSVFCLKPAHTGFPSPVPLVLRQGLGLEVILLPQPPKYWDYRHVLPQPAVSGFHDICLG